ncbi:hypothetical protein EV356DRAFT_170875 [Viridothelium virens]|uniref:Uncharacterized protein n=1 Tax=Viridothelium virens TaxID=1048519 RepID=A0A6A6HMG8_VIRVR|nr:hypothetical protein EV356DRAFT_170875 [Viridothelium virens]
MTSQRACPAQASPSTPSTPSTSHCALLSPSTLLHCPFPTHDPLLFSVASLDEFNARLAVQFTLVTVLRRRNSERVECFTRFVFSFCRCHYHSRHIHRSASFPYRKIQHHHQNTLDDQPSRRWSKSRPRHLVANTVAEDRQVASSHPTLNLLHPTKR